MGGASDGGAQEERGPRKGPREASKGQSLSVGTSEEGRA